MRVFEQWSWDAAKYVLLPIWIAIMVVAVPSYWRKSDLQTAFELGRRVGHKRPKG